MKHNWTKHEGRKQHECLNCGATVPMDVVGSDKVPNAKHMAQANHPGSAPHIVQAVRDLGEDCRGI